MPHVYTHGFPPGQYESLELTTWVSKVELDATKITARVRGTYTVYCGAGWEHEVQIDEQTFAWSSETSEEALEIWDIHMLTDSVNTKYDFAARMVEGALEDWSDPCEDDGEEN